MHQPWFWTALIWKAFAVGNASTRLSKEDDTSACRIPAMVFVSLFFSQLLEFLQGTHGLCSKRKSTNVRFKAGFKPTLIDGHY